MHGADFPSPVLHRAALRCITLSHARSATVLLAVLCCAAGCCAALCGLGTILGYVAWSHTASGFALHCPMLPALEMHSSCSLLSPVLLSTPPCCSPSPRCLGLPAASLRYAIQPGPLVLTLSYSVPCLTLPSPSHEFLIPWGVMLPGLLPAAPYAVSSCTVWPFFFLAHSSFLCGADPSQGLSSLCLTPSVLPLSHHEPQRPGAVQCLGALGCGSPWGCPEWGHKQVGGCSGRAHAGGGLPKVVA